MHRIIYPIGTLIRKRTGNPTYDFFITNLVNFPIQIIPRGESTHCHISLTEPSYIIHIWTYIKNTQVSVAVTLVWTKYNMLKKNPSVLTYYTLGYIELLYTTEASTVMIKVWLLKSISYNLYSV